MPENGAAPCNRFHIVLIPGFGGFDALGQVEYYAGITPLLQDLTMREKAPVVVHYFDNLPTAAVTTRAERLRKYLAKRIARGEILRTDPIILVGHSTGGLDIRQLVWDLDQRNRSNQADEVDGGAQVKPAEIRQCLEAAVFLSVPHWGTNIADWVRDHAALRIAVIAELQAAVAGSQLYLLDRIETVLAASAACATDADLLRALEDALTEANENFPSSLPPEEQQTRTANAQEAASELELFFRHMGSDFHVINDLTCTPPADPAKRSPAHFTAEEREQEFKLWALPKPIRTLSYATVGGRVFPFRSGRPGRKFELSMPRTYPEIVGAGTDLLYRLCYAACAGGPFQWPAQAGRISRVLGPPPPAPLELWDNDGIVNTGSMLWPRGEEIVLVAADHLDIVGHYELVRAPRDTGRAFQRYDSFKSLPRFTLDTFRDVWTEIFCFATAPKTFAHKRKSLPKRVQLAATAAAGC